MYILHFLSCLSLQFDLFYLLCISTILEQKICHESLTNVLYLILSLRIQTKLQLMRRSLFYNITLDQDIIHFSDWSRNKITISILIQLKINFDGDWEIKIISGFGMVPHEGWCSIQNELINALFLFHLLLSFFCEIPSLIKNDMIEKKSFWGRVNKKAIYEMNSVSAASQLGDSQTLSNLSPLINTPTLNGTLLFLQFQAIARIDGRKAAGMYMAACLCPGWLPLELWIN